MHKGKKMRTKFMVLFSYIITLRNVTVTPNPNPNSLNLVSFNTCIQNKVQKLL